MNRKRETDLKWLSDLSGRLVRELEEERQTLLSRMRAVAMRVVTEAIAAEKKAKKK